METLGFIFLLAFAHVHAYSIYGGNYGNQQPSVSVSTGRREDFNFVCPPGKVLSAFKSTNKLSDRLWGFGCTHEEGVLNKCQFSEFLNPGDDIYNFFDYECPNHGALVGIDTKYIDHFNERQYRFKCCDTAVSAGKRYGKKSPVRAAWYTECKEFEIVPKLGGSFHVDVPYGFVCLRWRADTNVQKKGDRIHSLQCCRISYCIGCYPYSAYPPYYDKGYYDKGYPGSGNYEPQYTPPKGSGEYTPPGDYTPPEDYQPPKGSYPYSSTSPTTSSP